MLITALNERGRVLLKRMYSTNSGFVYRYFSFVNVMYCLTRVIECLQQAVFCGVQHTFRLIQLIQNEFPVQ